MRAMKSGFVLGLALAPLVPTGVVGQDAPVITVVPDSQFCYPVRVVAALVVPAVSRSSLGWAQMSWAFPAGVSWRYESRHRGRGRTS